MAQVVTTPRQSEIWLQNISGQVIIGDHNKQYILQLECKHGDKVDHLYPDLQLRVQPRATHILKRPRRFSDLLDRTVEVDLAIKVLTGEQSVEFYGEAGIGKSVALRHLAYQAFTQTFPNGVINLPPGRPVEDHLQFLFDAFYTTNLPAPFIHIEPRLYLETKRALLLLDDAHLTQEEIEALMNAVPEATFLLASPQRRSWGEGRAVRLRGLPLPDALKLVHQELGRALTLEEWPAAEKVCELLQGHPEYIRHAVARVWDEGISLADMARRLEADALDRKAGTLFPSLIAATSGPEHDLVQKLAALGGASLSVYHLAKLTGLSEHETTSILENLQNRGWVESGGEAQYRLVNSVTKALKQAYDLTPQIEQLLAYFVSWARQNRYVPEDILKNIDACLQLVTWAVQTGRWQAVLQLGQAIEGALAWSGNVKTRTRILEWMFQAAQNLGNRGSTAWVYHQLGSWAMCYQDFDTARTYLVHALRVREALGDQLGAAVTRHNLNILLGTPPPSNSSSPEPLTPVDQPVLMPALIKLAIIIVLTGFIVLGGLGLWNLWQEQNPVVVAEVSSPTPTPTPVPPTETSTFTPVPPTGTPTPTGTSTPTPTGTRTPTPTGTFSPTPTDTATPTPTQTPTITSTPDVVAPPVPEQQAPENSAEILCLNDQLVSVTLRWVPVQDPSGVFYHLFLEQYQVSEEGWNKVNQQEGGPFPQIQQTVNIPCGFGYRWSVLSRDGAGNTNGWSSTSEFYLVPYDNTPPPAPELTEPANNTTTTCLDEQSITVALRWVAVDDPSDPVVYFVDVQRDDGTSIVKGEGPLDGTEYTLTLPCPVFSESDNNSGPQNEQTQPGVGLLRQGQNYASWPISQEGVAQPGDPNTYFWTVWAVDGAGNAGPAAEPYQFRIELYVVE